MNRRFAAGVVIVATLGFGIAMSRGVEGQGGATHTVFMNLVEIKGATTADKLPPPPVDPKDLSKGYAFKRPGEADKGAPQRWEVSSYMFVPSHVTVRQGDEVAITAFVVNGDEHEVWINAPDGTTVVPKATWNRGREYHAKFVAAEAGAYQIMCSHHAPSMVGAIFALPR